MRPLSPAPPQKTDSVASIRLVRGLLHGVLWIGLVGTGADLLLLDHVESWTQLIPLMSLALAAGALLIALLTGARAAVRAVQMTMLLTLLVGGLGMFLHVRGNADFQLEIDPSLSGTDLLWKSLRAKSPPALAPASMIQLGLVGFALSLLLPIPRTPSETPSPTAPRSGVPE
jgi:hypothetical protein